MASQILKILAILAVTSLVAGCKLAVMVPSGGDVTSASGTRNCAGGSLCEHDITAANFNESFTAVAKPGYVFTKWSNGPGFFCANSTNQTCILNNLGGAGNPAIEAFIATGQHLYAMPLFDFVGIDTDGDGTKDHLDADDDNDGVLDGDDACPVVGPNTNGFGCPTPPPNSDIVFANGREWYQVDLFTNLSWNDMNAVCPSGDCIEGGTLNGRDMTGWKWASVADIIALFNYYIGNPVLDPNLNGYAEFHEADSTWAPAFFADGWRGLPIFQETVIKGMTRDLPKSYGAPSGLVWSPLLIDYPAGARCIGCDAVQITPDYFTNNIREDAGAWFYRDP